MIVLGGLLFLLMLSFAVVLLFGAPYLPTLKPQVDAALGLAGLKKDDTMLELGCGDGKVVLAAAKQGAQVVGYELNPWLAGVAWLRTRRYRKQVRIVWGNFWRKEWPPADVIFVFLLPKYMNQLDAAIGRYDHKPVELVSFAFKIPDRPIAAEKRGVFLYNYPK